MAVTVLSFDNPEVMRVPQVDRLNLFFCSGVALVNYTGTGDDWRRDDLVFTVPSEQPGVGNPPPLAIPNFADSVVTVVPATIQNDDPDDRVGWGIDNAEQRPRRQQHPGDGEDRGQGRRRNRAPRRLPRSDPGLTGNADGRGGRWFEDARPTAPGAVCPKGFRLGGGFCGQTNPVVPIKCL